MTEKKMSSRLSASLDFARASAAIYVVLHHVAASYGFNNGIGAVLRFGQEAVLVFFLLSGFVIFLNEYHRGNDYHAYYWRRVRRIYPPLLIAMAVSALIAWDNGEFWTKFSWRDLVLTLLSVQDIASLKPGVISNPFFGNDPLWSLSYEIFFYLIFPFVLTQWKKNPALTNAAIGLFCCISYSLFALRPEHFLLVSSYFLVWWCGAMAAHSYLQGGKDFRAMATPLSWLAGLCVVSGMVVVLSGYHGLGFHPFLELRHFGGALLMIVFLYGPIGRFLSFPLGAIAPASAWLASISYGIYVLHFPILVHWHRARGPIGFVGGIFVLVFVAYATDRWLNNYLRRRTIKSVEPSTETPYERSLEQSTS